MRAFFLSNSRIEKSTLVFWRIMERILKFYKIYQRLSKLSFSWGALIWAGGIFAFFFLRTSPVWYGLSFPFFFLGIIQMGGAFRDYFSADERIRFMQRIESPSLVELKSSEKNFAEDVLRQGKTSRQAKLLLFVFGILLCISAVLGKWGGFSIGSGFGISLQSAVMLIFNLIKEYQFGVFHHETGK
jgi:hypothetical protein